MQAPAYSNRIKSVHANCHMCSSRPYTPMGVLTKLPGYLMWCKQRDCYCSLVAVCALHAYISYLTNMLELKPSLPALLSALKQLCCPVQLRVRTAPYSLVAACVSVAAGPPCPCPVEDVGVWHKGEGPARQQVPAHSVKAAQVVDARCVLPLQCSMTNHA
jgi:hypothetical protein